MLAFLIRSAKWKVNIKKFQSSNNYSVIFCEHPNEILNLQPLRIVDFLQFCQLDFLQLANRWHNMSEQALSLASSRLFNVDFLNQILTEQSANDYSVLLCHLLTNYRSLIGNCDTPESCKSNLILMFIN